MTEIKARRVERRRFLRAMTVAAGAAGFSPPFYGAAGSAVPIPAGVEAAPSDTGQTTLLAEYATRLRYEEIPAEVLQRQRFRNEVF